MVGKYVTPVFGFRAVIGGPFQTLDAKDGNAINYPQMGDIYSAKNKLFGELNVDGIINFSNIFAEDLAKFDIYGFVGPTVNLAKGGLKFVNGVSDFQTYIPVAEDDKVRAHVGATAGLGFGYNFTNAFELALEGRFGITPSVFGDGSQYRKGEGTSRLTLNAIWTIGGKHGKFARAAAAAAAAGYLSKEAADALARDYAEKNPKIVEKIVEKEVIKEVEKYINKEIPASTAVFFTIDKAVLSQKDKARLQLFAEDIKDVDSKFVVAGYADKKTGSAKRNQTLSEKRAQVVFDYLVSQGVPADKLETVANGGVDPIFFNNDVLSRTVIIKPKK
ncbi:MAG: OmpA family protein [Bacteroidales bacterium]|nr:OmpA family protein [Bacteroidales bacterium]